MFKVRCENGRTALIEIADSIDIPIGDILTGDLLNNSDEEITLYSADNKQHFSDRVQSLDIPKPH